MIIETGKIEHVLKCQNSQQTQFGGWPLSNAEVYHDVKQERFAKYADVTINYPPKKEA